MSYPLFFPTGVFNEDTHICSLKPHGFVIEQWPYMSYHFLLNFSHLGFEGVLMAYTHIYFLTFSHRVFGGINHFTDLKTRIRSRGSVKFKWVISSIVQTSEDQTVPALIKH